MRIRVRRRILSSAAAFAAALVVSAPAFAHGDVTFIHVEPRTVPPGGGVGVRADLLTSGPVRLTMAGTDGSRREVGTVEETVEGHFEVFFEVPSDLSTGHWTLLAEADDTVYGSTTIEVAGAAIDEEGGGQGPRDEDDPLLVPLPSGWQASRSSPPGTTRPPAALTNAVDPVPIVSLVAAVGALGFLFVRTRRGRPGGRDQPGR